MSETGVFSIVPDNFFSPLASPNRRHYAALLILYWRTFQEFPRGVERAELMRRFTEYFDLCRDAVAEEDGEPIGDTGEMDGAVLANTEGELFTGGEGDLDTDVALVSEEPARLQAGRFLRALVAAGWMSIETLEDYTKMVNVTSWARPFYEALSRIDEGHSTEYESHVVAIYSLLCSDAAEDNGHYAVLNAHESTVALNDSLKALLQGIKDHYERLGGSDGDGSVAELLHRHYDLYAQEILDGAYKRLKTSDNLSRYRPRILRRVQELKGDSAWLAASAAKYARSARIGIDEAKDRLFRMLDEIREVLKELDPLLAEIDRRNMQYARSSAERLRLLLEPDSSLASRFAQIARAVSHRSDLRNLLSHRLYRAAVLTPESRYRRWNRTAEAADFSDRSLADDAELERAEAELRLRIAKQLNPERVASWLDAKGGKDRPLPAASLVADSESWVRVLYAVLYAESRGESFGYTAEREGEGRVSSGPYDLPDYTLRRKR